MLKNALRKLRNILERRWYVSYKRVRAKIKWNPRRHVCECCGAKGWTSLHHWKYAYSSAEVRKDNTLAVHYTTELCFPCHELANAMRKLYEEDPELRIITKSKKLQKLKELRQKALKGG